LNARQDQNFKAKASSTQGQGLIDPRGQGHTRGQLPRPRPLRIRPRQKLRYAVHPDKIDKELNFDCFCLGNHLIILVAYKLLFTYY